MNDKHNSSVASPGRRPPVNLPWKMYYLSVEPNEVWFYPRVSMADFAAWLAVPGSQEEILSKVEKARLQSVPADVKQMIQASSPEAFNRYAAGIRLQFCREYGFLEKESTKDGHCFCGLRQGARQYSINFKIQKQIEYPICYYGVYLNRAGAQYGFAHPRWLPTLFWKLQIKGGCQ